jgi:hypothetical protein
MGPVDLPSGVVTTTSPVLPVNGATTFKKVIVEDVIVALTPLKVTTFFKASALKPVPVIVTGVLATPVNGLIEVIIGGTASVAGFFLQDINVAMKIEPIRIKEQRFFMIIQ